MCRDRKKRRLENCVSGIRGSYFGKSFAIIGSIGFLNEQGNLGILKRETRLRSSRDRGPFNMNTLPDLTTNFDDKDPKIADANQE